MGRLALQHLFEEVVGDLLLIARQTGGSLGGIVAATQERRREHDRASPSLGPLLQSLGRLLRQVQPNARRNGTGLLRVQSDERCPDLDQLPVRTQSGERQFRTATCDEHQLRAGWNPVGDEREDGEALLCRDKVRVVQYQHERAALVELGSEEGQDGLVDARVWS